MNVQNHNIDGCQSTIENKIASLSDDLNQVFGEFHQNHDEDRSSQFYNLNREFHDDNNQHFPISNNRKSIVSQSQKFKSQNQSCISQQRSQFKDILKDISPRQRDSTIEHKIFTDDEHFYNQKSRSISNDVMSQYVFENKRKSSEDKFSNQIKQLKHQNDHDNSFLSYKENSVIVYTDDRVQSRQKQSINDFNVKDQSDQRINQQYKQQEMDSRYKELLRYAHLNKLLNQNNQIDHYRSKLINEKSIENTQEFCGLNDSQSQQINQQTYQKNKQPPFSEQHGKFKKQNIISSEYGTVCHQKDDQQWQYQKDQADSCTQNTLSVKFNDFCIQLQKRDESIINPMYFVQNTESISQNTDETHLDNQNNQIIGKHDQIDLKYLKYDKSSQENLQYQEEGDCNQQSIDIGNNMIQMNKGTDPKTISSSSQLSIAKQQRNLNYQQLLKSQYEDINQEDESHFFSITDIQYQDNNQPNNQISKEQSLNEQSKHKMLDVLYFSLNQNSEKSNQIDGQNNRNVDYFNPYSQQNTSSSINQTLNQAFMNQTTSTEQEYYRKKISQQLNMNLKSEFGKKLMDGQRLKQFSPFQDHYVINDIQNNKFEQQEQQHTYLQANFKDTLKIYEQKHQNNPVISQRTKSSYEN